VRGAAQAIQRAFGKPITAHPGYAVALQDVAVFINAALTALDSQRELQRTDGGVPVVFGVYDLTTHCVSACFLPKPNSGPLKSVPLVAAPPQDAEGFVTLAEELVASPHIASLLA